MRLWLVPLALALSAFNPAPLFAQPTPAAPKPLAGAELRDYIRANYTKYEYPIPMRDGVKLFTSVYVPKDDTKTYPMMLTRTPYSVAPYGADKYPDNLRPGALFAQSGYIFVQQDVRGRWMSEGEFVNVRPHNPNKKGAGGGAGEPAGGGPAKPEVDESSDTYDTVEWLIKNVKGHNGKVGITGISYPGFYTVTGMIDAHPAVKAVSPQAPVSEWFIGDDFHHNGCLFLPHCFNFMYGFGKNRPEPTKKGSRDRFDHDTPDGYKFFLEMGPLKNADAKYYKGEIAFWKEVMDHPNYDEFWKARNIRQHVRNIKPAVLTVGGWFDAENLFGALEIYKHAEANNPPPNNHLVMGPWDHGGWSRGAGDHLGDVKFNSNTSEFFREKIEFPFFEQHLKGENTDPRAQPRPYPKAWVFETGTNVWRKFDAWPPKDAMPTKFYFGNANPGHLSDRLYPPLPGSNDPPKFDEFVSDPAKPVPFINKTDIGMVREYMTADQRFASTRPDVLVYQGEVLKSDLTLAGPIEVELYVSTTGTDADWVVKVIDVYPDDFPDLEPNPAGVKMGGYQQLIRGEPFRGKFRNSFEKPEPFKPGEVTKVKFVMPDVFHTLRPGHRLMVQVQSTWFPLVDRNPQTFCDINKADASAFKKQTHKVYRDAEHPSKITVGVVK